MGACWWWPDFGEIVAIFCTVSGVLAAAAVVLWRRSNFQVVRKKKPTTNRLDRSQQRSRRFAAALVCGGAGLVTVVRVATFPLTTTTTTTTKKKACACRSFSCLDAREKRRGRKKKTKKKRSAPFFWLGGGQKCGTTTLYEVLATHPGVVAPSPKEPGFFARPAPYRYLRESWYVRDVLRYGEACERQKVTFDATAYYLQWDVAPALLRASPDVKAVFVFREPIARAMSWLQHMALKYTTIPNCLHHMDMGCCVQQRWFKTSVRHLDGSLYAKHLRRWASSGFPRDNALFVRFEDIVDRGLDAVYADILTFLDLEQVPPLGDASAIANKRSTRPYDVPVEVYEDLVHFVHADAADLTNLVDRDFEWWRIWHRQLLQCYEDGLCRVSLTPVPRATLLAELPSNAPASDLLLLALSLPPLAPDDTKKMLRQQRRRRRREQQPVDDDATNSSRF